MFVCGLRKTEKSSKEREEVKSNPYNNLGLRLASIPYLYVTKKWSLEISNLNFWSLPSNEIIFDDIER